MAALGHHILAKDPNATDIKDRLKKLAEDQRAIAELWNNKNQELIDARDLQVPRTITKKTLRCFKYLLSKMFIFPKSLIVRERKKLNI